MVHGNSQVSHVLPFEIDPYDIAPVLKRVTIESTLSTSSELDTFLRIVEIHKSTDVCIFLFLVHKCCVLL